MSVYGRRNDDDDIDIDMAVSKVMSLRRHVAQHVSLTSGNAMPSDTFRTPYWVAGSLLTDCAYTRNILLHPVWYAMMRGQPCYHAAKVLYQQGRMNSILFSSLST